MNRDEVGFIDGQLAPQVGLPLARKVAALAATGNWEGAQKLLAGNETANRILARCKGVLK